MKANESEVLLLRDYVGTGATREQFIKTFATASSRRASKRTKSPSATSSRGWSGKSHERGGDRDKLDDAVSFAHHPRMNASICGGGGRKPQP